MPPDDGLTRTPSSAPATCEGHKTTMNAPQRCEWKSVLSSATEVTGNRSRRE